MFKRVRLWRVFRSRSHLKPAVLVVICLASSIFVFDSAFTERRTEQGHFQHIEESHVLITNTTQAQQHHDLHSDAPRVVMPGGVSAGSREGVVLQTQNGKKNDNIDGYESNISTSKPTKEAFHNDNLVILSENVQKYSKKNKKLGRITDNKETNVGPSFGFVNKDFQQPPPRQGRGDGLFDALQGFVKGQTLISPGSLFGVVAALKQFQTSWQSQNNDKQLPNDSKAQQSRVTGAPDTHYSVGGGHEQDREPDVLKGTDKQSRKSQTDDTEGEDKDQSLSRVQTPNHSRSGRRGMKDTQGIMSSLQGHNGSPGQSVLGSHMKVLAPPVPSGGHIKNGRQMEGAAGVSKTSPLQALMGGLGPLLLGGLGNLGGSRRGPDSSFDSGKVNPLHSIISQVGSSIMAEAALNPSKTIPLQSLVANLGPALLSTFTQRDNQNTDGKKKAPSSPVQAILAGLVPAVMTGVFQQGLDGNNSRNPSPQSPLQAILNVMGQSNMKGTGRKQTGLGGFLAGVAPVLMAGASRQGSRTLQETKEKADTEHDYNNVASSDDPESSEFGGATGLGVGGAAVKMLLRAAVSSMLPEELPLPEINSTGSLWDMAVNVAFGNPRDDRDRNSGFWQWVSEYIGGEAPSRNTEDSTPAWITAALTTHAVERQANTQTLLKVYQRLEDPQPLCQRVRSMGGSFNWKTGVLSNARDVCMDGDVAPRSNGCTVYSFGIRDKWNFEEDMEDLGCEVWAFDPAMTSGNHNHSSHIHFYNLGLTSSTPSSTITKEGKRWQVFPLAKVMERLGHATSTIDYLKLDIGGSEWQVLHETAKHSRHALTNLRQLAVEVHLEAALRDPSLYSLYLDALKSLESLGFQLFSSHMSQGRGWSYQDPSLGRRVSLHYNLAFLRV